MTLLYWLIGVLGAIVALYTVWPRKRYFPGPPIYGVFGTTEVRHFLNARHRYWRSKHEKSRVFQLQRGTTPMFVVYEPEDAKLILSDRTVFPDRPTSIIGALGPNVLSMPIGDEWAKHRRLLSPLFAEKFMKEYALMVDGKLKSLSQRLRRTTAPVDVLQVVMSVALDFIGICGFGVDFGCTEGDGQTSFMKASNTLLEQSIRAQLIPWYLRLFDFEGPRRMREAIKTIRDQCDAVRGVFHEMQDSHEFNRRAMITELLGMEEAGEFTRDQVTSEMSVLLLAGHETTATTVSWALYYIARDAALQRRLQAEVDAALKQPDSSASEGSVTIKILDHLPLIKGTMYEALRMRPTVVAVARLSAVPFEFPSSPGVVCPAGSIALVSFYTQSFNRKVWGDDVDTFKPDRHVDIDSDDQKRHPFSFLPFGAGPRVCLGRRFAVQEAQLLLMQIIRDFDVSLPPNAPEPGEKLDITLKPTNLNLIFTPRKKI